MSILDGTPTPLHPQSCGLCRHWAPWLRREMLGTCGAEGPMLGHCTDKHDTCKNFEERKR